MLCIEQRYGKYIVFPKVLMNRTEHLVLVPVHTNASRLQNA